MPTKRRMVLDALRAELTFVESGAYRHPLRAAWRPQFIFEDSPTCLNRDPIAPRKPCSECILAKFLPSASVTGRVPCRDIPLNQTGQTINSLYSTGTQEELESAVTAWLKSTIERLEREEAEALRSQDHPVVSVQAKFVPTESLEPEPSMLSVCANPECSEPFTCGEGRFFRFRQTRDVAKRIVNTHAVRHLWLCGECSARLTLELQNGTRIVLKNRPDAPSQAETSRAICTI